jgi:hypothetical protein
MASYSIENRSGKDVYRVVHKIPNQSRFSRTVDCAARAKAVVTRIHKIEACLCAMGEPFTKESLSLCLDNIDFKEAITGKRCLVALEPVEEVTETPALTTEVTLGE